MLSLEDFKQVVANAPLFAIDLVVMNAQGEILLGERKNAPAKGYWFVPGGRVYKNESLDDAFARISQAELGVALDRSRYDLLGIFDHFYPNSVFDERISTHYINTPYLICLTSAELIQLASLPQEQHRAYRWVHWQLFDQVEQIHSYSKVFLPKLRERIKHD